jgi:hypothetical protein
LSKIVIIRTREKEEPAWRRTGGKKKSRPARAAFLVFAF